MDWRRFWKVLVRRKIEEWKVRLFGGMEEWLF